MIKKINIALVSAFVAILLASAMRGMFVGKKAEPAPGDAPEIASAAQAVPDVNVYYVRWAKYAMPNRISNRNGVLLDLMRALFHGAAMHCINGDVKRFAEKLSEDPSAVVVGFGNHPDLATCRRAPTPLAFAPLVVRTLRSNPWRFGGTNSIDELRLVVRRSLLDYSVIRDRVGDGSGRMIVVDSSTSVDDIAALIEDGKADGFVATGESRSSELEMTSAQILQRFRTSDIIAKDPVYLYVSNIDPAFADAVIDAYEKGVKRIDASGERARIFAYYDMTP